MELPTDKAAPLPALGDGPHDRFRRVDCEGATHAALNPFKIRYSPLTLNPACLPSSYPDTMDYQAEVPTVGIMLADRDNGSMHFVNLAICGWTANS